MTFSIVDSHITGTPVIYNGLIGATVGGMQCYNLYKSHNQDINHSQDYSIIQTVVPYIVDIITLYSVTKNLNFDFSSSLGQVVAIKQSFVILSSIVAADYITKLSLPNYSIPNPIYLS